MPLAASLKRALKNRAKRHLRTLFEVGQRFGLNILPHHHYASIPDMRYLRSTDRWMQPSSMAGVAGTDPEQQLAFVREVCRPYSEQLAAAPPGDIYQRAIGEAGEVGYGPTEAEFLYCFIASQSPRKIVQIGCGLSTALVLRALRDAGHSSELVCIEPYPSAFLREMDRTGRIRLLPQKAQDVELSHLTELEDGDLLFIDSTHAVTPGSEVVRMVLEVMPRLRPGVFVHFHDIFFPYTYTRGILSDELFFWVESILLQALLVDNPRYRIRAAMSMLHYDRPGELQQIFPHYDPAPNRQGLYAGPGHFPSALYLQRTEPPPAES